MMQLLLTLIGFMFGTLAHIIKRQERPRTVRPIPLTRATVVDRAEFANLATLYREEFGEE